MAAQAARSLVAAGWCWAVSGERPCFGYAQVVTHGCAACRFLSSTAFVLKEAAVRVLCGELPKVPKKTRAKRPKRVLEARRKAVLSLP